MYDPYFTNEADTIKGYIILQLYLEDLETCNYKVLDDRHHTINGWLNADTRPYPFFTRRKTNLSSAFLKNLSSAFLKEILFNSLKKKIDYTS